MAGANDKWSPLLSRVLADEEEVFLDSDRCRTWVSVEFADCCCGPDNLPVASVAESWDVACPCESWRPANRKCGLIGILILHCHACDASGHKLHHHTRWDLVTLQHLVELGCHETTRSRRLCCDMRSRYDKYEPISVTTEIGTMGGSKRDSHSYLNMLYI